MGFQSHTNLQLIDIQRVRAVHAKSDLNEESKIDIEISKFLPLQKRGQKIPVQSFTDI